MSIYPIQDAFVRGELSPRLHSRASLDLYKAGLSLCENFITLPHGGLRKRGGSYYVDEVIQSTRNHRAIPFVFSSDQAYMILIGHQKLRIYAYGARVGTVELAAPWTDSEIFQVKYKQVNDEMRLTHPNNVPRILTRLAHTSWTLEPVDFLDGPFDSENTDSAVTIAPDATTGTVNMTASEAIFEQADIARLIRVDLQTYQLVRPWEAGGLVEQPTLNARRHYEGRIYVTPTDFNSPGTMDVRSGTLPPTHKEGTEWDGPGTLQGVPDAAYVLKDNYYGLQWTLQNLGYGIMRIASVNVAGTVATGPVLSAMPDYMVGSSTYKWRLGAFRPGEYPGSVAFFEERLMYGRRFSVYGSKTGNFGSFETGAKDDDALKFTNAGGQANDIVWLEDIGGQLAIGTIGGVRSLSGSGIDEALTPSSFKGRKSITPPCADVSPALAQEGAVYVAKGGKALIELRLGQNLRFEANDLGQISEHIPKLGVVEVAFQNYPDPILWFPCYDGQLGSMTYQPAQEVRGMHRHKLGGSWGSTSHGIVESACVTPGQDGRDDVWLIVKRTIGGVTKRYIEILQPPFEYDAVMDGFQVDCGLSYSGAAVNSTIALHLKGQTVDVLADSKVYRGLVASNVGTVTLPGGVTASEWHLGLPFESSADTLELDVGGRDGSLIGRKKRIAKVILSVFETDLTGLQVASLQKNRWENVKIPSIAAPSATVQLETRNIEVPIDDSWEGQGRVRIRHRNPTPCTIRSIAPVFDNEP